MYLLREDREWLSLQDIARAWSEETGGSAQALEGSFREWFKEFLVRNGYVEADASDTGDEPGIMAELLEERPIWRDTFENFCEERGLAKPRFWFPNEPDGQAFVQAAGVSKFKAATEEIKSSWITRAVMILVAYLLSWSIVILPIWLLIRA